MKVVSCFTKEDGTLTPEFTVEDIKNKKYREYGITDKHIADIIFNIEKTLIEGIYPNIKVTKGEFLGEH